MIKKVLVLAIVAVSGLSSCNKSVCPAYSRAKVLTSAPASQTASIAKPTTHQ